jgi:integrase
MHIRTAEWAERALAAVESRDIIDWLNVLRKKTVAYKHGAHRNNRRLGFQSRKHCLNLARALFTDAITEGFCKMNPVLGVKLKKTDDDHVFDKVPEEWPLKPAEQAKVLATIGNDPERWIVLFAIGTGLRQGEMWNLHVDDVHAEDEHPFVYVRFGSKGRLPKNRKIRRVPLFGIGLEAARAWLNVLPTYAPTNPEKLMFPTPHREPGAGGKRRAEGGALRGIGKLPLAWKKAKVVLGRRVWWHLLRHTCATALLCGWWGRKWKLEEVGKMLGHSSVRTTEMYAHLLDSALTEVAVEMQEAWEKKREGEEAEKTATELPRSKKTSGNGGGSGNSGAVGQRFESSVARH